MSEDMMIKEEPSWSKPCENCDTTVQRWPGEGDVSCRHCHAQYNVFGQHLRDDWHDNPSAHDDAISDLEGFEIQHAHDY